MAETVTTRHLVRPDGWRDAPFTDTHHFDLEVTRRNAALPDEPEEWAVSQRGFDRFGFTKSGVRVGLTYGNSLNRRHGVFSEADALQLARDLADGKIVTRDYTTLAQAIERYEGRTAADEKAAERINAAQGS